MLLFILGMKGKISTESEVNSESYTYGILSLSHVFG
jgi:hypothetical protein